MMTYIFSLVSDNQQMLTPSYSLFPPTNPSPSGTSQRRSTSTSGYGSQDQDSSLVMRQWQGPSLIMPTVLHSTPIKTGVPIIQGK